MQKTIRYKLNKFGTELYLGDNYNTVSITNSITCFPTRNDYFFDILEKPQDAGVVTILWKVRMYFPTGEVMTGWIRRDDVVIHNYDELFDGRFNVA